MAEHIFKSMSPEAARFYQKVFNRVLLNMYAVQRGMFDTLLCDTDDPEVIARWSKALPSIAFQMQDLLKRRAQGE